MSTSVNQVCFFNRKMETRSSGCTKRKVYEISSSDDDDDQQVFAQKVESKTKIKIDLSDVDATKISKRALPKKSARLKDTRQRATATKNAKTTGKTIKHEPTTFPDGTEIKYISPGDTKYLKDELRTKPARKLTKIKVEPLWQEDEILAQEHKLSPHIAKNIVELLKEGNTIPFIARYRKDAVGLLNADELRDVKSTYDDTLELKQKIVTTYNKISELGKMNPLLERTLLGSQSAETVEEIYAPYKPVTGAASLKHQIHSILAPGAESILQGETVSFAEFVNAAKGLENVDLVQKHVISVMAKVISTSASCLQYVQKMRTEAQCTLQTKKINKRSATSEKGKGLSGAKASQSKDASNFRDYYDRTFATTHLKPHQIMAVNRAEHLKFINVTLTFSDFSRHFCYELRQGYLRASRGRMGHLLEAALVECYHSHVISTLKCMKRAELKSFAEKASLDIFNNNLKRMLLAAPVRSRAILGVDPGFAHGCKLGVISATGAVLATRVVYPHRKPEDSREKQVQEEVVRDLLIEHQCSLLALGNGTACRETEAWLTDMIQRGVFEPLKVSYTIVNESGASIYSCSKEATKEFSNLDPNLISAVSLARRVQDPLSELVKVEPQHLGVGMYQHDVRPKRLAEALAGVVSECVSFVGVDVNSASQCLLRHVAGLSERRADELVAHRQRHGAFRAREDLLQVKGIGALTYKQCAGFLRIAHGRSKLDATIVHPESYHIAVEVIERLQQRVDHIGSDAFISSVRAATPELLAACAAFKTTRENLAVVLEGLSKPLEYDLREEGSRQPLFRQGVTDMATLRIGMALTGAVNNCTSFGSFVDVGMGVSGLLHVKNARGVQLQVGDRVEVKVVSLELKRKRIGLELVHKL